jgi:hypothetical protein
MRVLFGLVMMQPRGASDGTIFDHPGAIDGRQGATVYHRGTADDRLGTPVTIQVLLSTVQVLPLTVKVSSLTVEAPLPTAEKAIPTRGVDHEGHRS